MPVVDPGLILQVNSARCLSRTAFSHSLDPQESVAATATLAQSDRLERELAKAEASRREMVLLSELLLPDILARPIVRNRQISGD